MRGSEAGLRANFIEQIHGAARHLGLVVEWSPDRWVAVISGPSQSSKVVGYTFELNDAASAEAALDKVVASDLLDRAGVPVVPHRLIETTSAGWRERLPADCMPPVVLKPHRGSGGADVRRAESVSELHCVLTHLAGKHGSFAYSPFIPADAEYRVVVLDGDVLLTYAKRHAENETAEWKYNLSHGAVAAPVLPGDSEHALVTALAQRATAALKLRFGAVDVLATGGQHRVMEVNDAFSLVHFSATSPSAFEAASAVYRRVLAVIFD